jgi:hypothetical protein
MFGHCVYQSEANYFLWGIISRLCEGIWPRERGVQTVVPLGENVVRMVTGAQHISSNIPGHGWSYVEAFKHAVYGHAPSENDRFAYLAGYWGFGGSGANDIPGCQKHCAQYDKGPLSWHWKGSPHP